MLVSRSGMVIYSTDKSSLFSSNLLTGPWRDGPAGQLFRSLAAGTEADGIAFSEMLPDPAYGNTTRGFGAFGVYRGGGR
jgi:hypothetical protein